MLGSDIVLQALCGAEREWRLRCVLLRSSRRGSTEINSALLSVAQLNSAQSTSANFSSVQLSLAQLTSGVARSVHTVMAANFGCDVLDAMRAHLSFCDEFPLRY